jgi:hypothetical protein
MRHGVISVLHRPFESGARFGGARPVLSRNRLVEIAMAVLLTLAALLFVAWTFWIG